MQAAAYNAAVLVVAPQEMLLVNFEWLFGFDREDKDLRSLRSNQPVQPACGKLADATEVGLRLAAD
jgi:hypothetical protein